MSLGVLGVQRGDRGAAAHPQVGAVSLGARSGARPEVPIRAGAATVRSAAAGPARGLVWRNEPLDRD